MGVALVAVLAVVRVTCYLAPVDAPIIEPFDAPACTYCPGHRGVEYDIAPGTPVRAATSGVVTFNGVVAGTRYLVVLGDDGLSATYGMLASAGEVVGQRVTVGGTIATAGTRLYFGLRDGEAYLDPAVYLGVVRHRARLVPSSGRPGRPARTMSPTCPAVTSGR